MIPVDPLTHKPRFLSSNTQDFIEVHWTPPTMTDSASFLSSNTQDFIEVRPRHASGGVDGAIPEL